ncbi:DUF4149 domain-containing protein [Ottowia sp.]|uniref:DUF4149 domain-containing protein n=1 Tax=Ottowia sp. TaxID=1898956 RepID=UPI002D1FACB3|nr:DUF4149 domain-containing protein [Ottowia sp.]
MKSLTIRLPVLAAALWWGSMSVTGFMAVPLLFLHLPSKALAGGVAAHLFAGQTWVSVACGIVLLLRLRPQHAPTRVSGAAQTTLVFVLAGLLAALLLQYAVAPRILARVDLRLWHSAGVALYALQWLCAGAALWRLIPACVLGRVNLDQAVDRLQTSRTPHEH